MCGETECETALELVFVVPVVPVALDSEEEVLVGGDHFPILKPGS